MQKKPFVKEIYNAKFKQLPSDYKTLSKEEAKQIKLQHVSPLLPQQEMGIRESCALPYELYVDGNLSDDKSKFEIAFHVANQVSGEADAGSPFNVYASQKYAGYDGNKHNC